MEPRKRGKTKKPISERLLDSLMDFLVGLLLLGVEILIQKFLQ